MPANRLLSCGPSMPTRLATRSRKKVNENQIFYNRKSIGNQLPAIFKSLTITEEVRQNLRKELSDFFAAEAEGDGELKAAEARLTKLDRIQKNLQRLFVEEELSLTDFKEHRSQIEAESQGFGIP